MGVRTTAPPLVALLLACGAGAGAQTVTEFPVPTPDARPGSITSGADGNLWFTETNANRIGRITTSGVVAEFALSPGVPGSDFPANITAHPDGNLWFIHNVSGNEAVARISPTGVVTRFRVRGLSRTHPSAVAVGSDFNVWFLQSAPEVNAIARLHTSGLVTEFPLPSPAATPERITAGPDGNLWFTEPGANRIGRITTEGAITEFSVPTPTAGLGGITAGRDGNLWFTESLTSKVGRITPSGVVTEFTIPTLGGFPTEIAPGPDGNVWFTESLANKVGRITPAGVVTEFAFPTPAAALAGITTGPDGRLWLTEANTNRIARFPVPDLLRILPVVGSTPGAGGTFFKTSVQLYNSFDAPITGRIVFHPSGASGAGSDPFLAYSIAPGETRSIADLLPAMGRSGLGSADIVPDSGPPPVVTARVFNDAGASGTTGFTEEAMRAGEALRAGQTGVLLIPADFEAFRFNVGVRTLEEGASVTFTLRTAGGTVFGSSARTFPGSYHEQQGAVSFLHVFEVPPGGSISISVDSGAAIFYGATVDNRTGDPSLQTARPGP